MNLHCFLFYDVIYIKFNAYKDIFTFTYPSLRHTLPVQMITCECKWEEKGKTTTFFSFFCVYFFLFALVVNNEGDVNKAKPTEF